MRVSLRAAHAAWRAKPLSAVVFPCVDAALAAAHGSGSNPVLFTGAAPLPTTVYELDTGTEPPPSPLADCDVRVLARQLDCADLPACTFVVLVVDPSLACLKASWRVRALLARADVALVCNWWPGQDKALRAALAPLIGSKEVTSFVEPLPEFPIERNRPSCERAKVVGADVEALRAVRGCIAQNRVLPTGRVLVVVETLAAAKFYKVRAHVVEKKALFAGSAQLPPPGEWTVVFPAEFLVAYEERMVLTILARLGYTFAAIRAFCWSADGVTARVEPHWAQAPPAEAVREAIRLVTG